MVQTAHPGVLTGWVVHIPLPGNETQPARPVGQRAGGPRRSKMQRGPSRLHPDDGARSSGPLPATVLAGHKKHPANVKELHCVPSPDAAGHACGPQARAKRASRPRIIDDLGRAREWQRMIAAGEVKNAAELARRYGVTRARVSQLLGLLRLAPEILSYIDGLSGTEGALHLTARRLRDIAILDNRDEQRARFRDLVGRPSATSPSGASQDDPSKEDG